ncbi:MAG TPA: alpha/beta hydrolase [Acidimicrobiia bacterium]|nr:alpha/beta hydrolase [Acidimicrobiia bacterium]
MGPRTYRITSVDGAALHVEEEGAGAPILFIHEFAGDHRSWEPQVRYFSKAHRCITYSARGYPPSDVPDDADAYSQAHAIDDALAVMDGLAVEQAHVVGLSMGGFCALHLARLHPERLLSTAIAGVGYGATPDKRISFRRECEAIAKAFAEEGSAQVAARYAIGPARVQFQNKDPRGHARFAAALAQHSPIGSSLTMRGVQANRPSLYDFEMDFATMTTPVLIMVGDEDEGAIEASLMLKKAIPTAGLSLFPKSGHTLNLEEPEMFNESLVNFFKAVAGGNWGPRDPRSFSLSITGMSEPNEAAEEML